MDRSQKSANTSSISERAGSFLLQYAVPVVDGLSVTCVLSHILKAASASRMVNVAGSTLAGVGVGIGSYVLAKGYRRRVAPAHDTAEATKQSPSL